MPRYLSTIAEEIIKDWPRAKQGAAKPYCDAMRSLSGIEDYYSHDTGKSVVLYFLSNAASWRGETARRIKKELNEMVK